MRFIEALQKSETHKAQRGVNSASSVHVWTIYRKSHGYKLSRQVFGVGETFEREDTWDFRCLTDLFAAAKQQGFFQEIMPNASDWDSDSRISDLYLAIDALNDYYPADELANYYASAESDSFFAKEDEDFKNDKSEEDEDYDEEDWYYEEDPSLLKLTGIEAQNYYNTIY